jgi:hypothetical protein
MRARFSHRGVLLVGERRDPDHGSKQLRPAEQGSDRQGSIACRPRLVHQPRGHLPVRRRQVAGRHLLLGSQCTGLRRRGGGRHIPRVALQVRRFRLRPGGVNRRWERFRRRHGRAGQQRLLGLDAAPGSEAPREFRVHHERVPQGWNGQSASAARAAASSSGRHHRVTASFAVARLHRHTAAACFFHHTPAALRACSCKPHRLVRQPTVSHPGRHRHLLALRHQRRLPRLPQVLQWRLVHAGCVLRRRERSLLCRRRPVRW